jgi:DNA-nicking Smr family endonuclease
MTRRPPRNRELSEEERRLWEQAMRETTALHSRGRGAAIPGAGEEATPAQRANQAAEKGGPREPDTSGHSAPSPPRRGADKVDATQVTPLARREARRIARDPESIDARLDLHGMRQRDAYPALKGFLRASQSRGHRLVLVITGKGVARETARDAYDAWESRSFYESPRGVLRRLVPEWLAKPEFQDVVAGVSPAHQRHGGEGALYVRLRRIGPKPTTPGRR